MMRGFNVYFRSNQVALQGIRGEPIGRIGEGMSTLPRDDYLMSTRI